MPMKLNIIDYKTNDDTGNQFVAMFGGSAVPVQYESYRFPVRSPETFSITTKVFSSGLHGKEKRVTVSRCIILKTKKSWATFWLKTLLLQLILPWKQSQEWNGKSDNTGTEKKKKIKMHVYSSHLEFHQQSMGIDSLRPRKRNIANNLRQSAHLLSRF